MYCIYMYGFTQDSYFDTMQTKKVTSYRESQLLLAIQKSAKMFSYQNVNLAHTTQNAQFSLVEPKQGILIFILMPKT